MLVVSYLAYSLPMVLLVWGAMWILMVRRKGIRLRAAPVTLHLAVVLALVAVMNVGTNKDTGVVFLGTLLLSWLSCAVLRPSAAKST